MAKNFRDSKTDFLFEGILQLKTLDECYAFFEDLCTVSEITEMSKRLHAARMLTENSVYTEVTEQTGLSTATISRVNRCLKYGTDGYKTVLDRMKKQ